MGNLFSNYSFFRGSQLSNNNSDNRSILSVRSINFIDNIRNNNKNKITKLRTEWNIFPKINFELIENSIKLVKDNKMDNYYHLNFSFNINSKILIKIYFNGFYDTEFNFHSNIRNILQNYKNEDDDLLIEDSEDNNSFKFYKGNNINFGKGNYIINMNEVKYESLINVSDKYPLIIEGNPFYDDMKENMTEYGYKFPKITKYYYLVKFNKNDLTGVIYMIIVKINDKFIKLDKMKENNLTFDFKSTKFL